MPDDTQYQQINIGGDIFIQVVLVDLCLVFLQSLFTHMQVLTSVLWRTKLLILSSMVREKEGNYLWVPLLFPMYPRTSSIIFLIIKYRGSGSPGTWNMFHFSNTLPPRYTSVLPQSAMGYFPHCLRLHSPHWMTGGMKGSAHIWVPLCQCPLCLLWIFPWPSQLMFHLVVSICPLM